MLDFIHYKRKCGIMEQYHYEYDHKQTTLIPLSSSVILHLLVLFLLLYITLDHTQLQEVLYNPSKLFSPPDHTLAALKPRASNFGLPTHLSYVSADDEQDQAQDKQNGSSQDQDNETFTSHNDKDTAKENKASPDNNQLQAISPSADTVKPHSVDAQSNTQDTSHAESKIVSPTSQTRRKKPRAPHSQLSQKQPLSFADLARGFIENVKNEGNDWLERRGDVNKRPDKEDLRKISYMQKLIWYMQNEWRIEQDKIEPYITTNLIVTVLITILQDGRLASATIVQSSGNPIFDQFMIDGIKRASPYPPVPRHFNTSSFDLELSIYCTQQQRPNANLKSYTL